MRTRDPLITSSLFWHDTKPMRHSQQVRAEKSYNDIFSSAKSRERARRRRAMPGIINSTIPPQLFLVSVDGSTTFYPLHDAYGAHRNARNRIDLFASMRMGSDFRVHSGYASIPNSARICHVE